MTAYKAFLKNLALLQMTPIATKKPLNNKFALILIPHFVKYQPS